MPSVLLGTHLLKGLPSIISSFVEYTGHPNGMDPLEYLRVQIPVNASKGVGFPFILSSGELLRFCWAYLRVYGHIFGAFACGHCVMHSVSIVLDKS